MEQDFNESSISLSEALSDGDIDKFDDIMSVQLTFSSPIDEVIAK